MRYKSLLLRNTTGFYSIVTWIVITWTVVTLCMATATTGCAGRQSEDSTQADPTLLSSDVGDEGSPFEGLVFYCTRCKKEVPETMGAGTSCPHCGAFFKSATNADGSNIEVDPPSGGVPVRYWGPVVLILMFFGEYLFRKWRKRKLEE